MRQRGMLLVTCIAIGVFLLCVGTAHAQMMKKEASQLDQLFFRAEGVITKTVISPIDETEGLSAEVQQRWQDFAVEHPGWRGTIDLRSGNLEFAEGPGLPWVPGFGNELTAEDIALYSGGRDEPDLTALERIARDFVGRWAGLLGVDLKQLLRHRLRQVLRLPLVRRVHPAIRRYAVGRREARSAS